MCREINKGDWWWDTQDRLPIGAMIVSVICGSDKTHVTNFSCDQHARLVYLTIGNIQNEIRHTPTELSSICVRPIPCPLNGTKNIDKAWHSAVGIVLSQHRHLDIIGSGLKWDCADGLQHQC
jgi:hypothetical protein